MGQPRGAECRGTAHHPCASPRLAPRRGVPRPLCIQRRHCQGGGAAGSSPPLASPSPHTAALWIRRAGHLREEGAARAARSPSAGGAGRSGGTGAPGRPERFVSIKNDLLASERRAPAI